MNTRDIAIQLTHVSKKYEIHHEKPTLVEKFVKGRNETFWALKDINLTIKKGEKIGIIGLNGSGKTTLLKIIAGITTPTKGTVVTNGKIVSLIDLEAGFHVDLTGLQNIYLNGMLLGMNKREINRKLPDIIRFANIKQFIDVPLYTYSSGMKLRLGFAIAVHTKPDILILDEYLTVGDKEFQKKSYQKIQELLHGKITLVVVSQNLTTVRKLGKRYIWIDKGTVQQDNGRKVLTQYATI